MRIGYLRSIDYFSISIGDCHDHALYVSFVLWRRGVSFNFFERKHVTRALEIFRNQQPIIRFNRMVFPTCNRLNDIRCFNMMNGVCLSDKACEHKGPHPEQEKENANICNDPK